MNPREDTNNFQTDANVNARKNDLNVFHDTEKMVLIQRVRLVM